MQTVTTIGLDIAKSYRGRASSRANRAGPGLQAGGSALEFILYGAHTGAEFEGTNMPLVVPIPKGGTFFCPHCGAMYSITPPRPRKRDGNTAKCVVCRRVMDAREPTEVPFYKLIHRPEDA
jgi:hypothetical protein